MPRTLPAILYSALSLSALLATRSCNAKTATHTSNIRSPSNSECTTPTPPFVQGRTMVDGILSKEEMDNQSLEVRGCCTTDPEITSLHPSVIGTMPQFTQDQSLSILRSSMKAWDGGSGTWPQMSLKRRVELIEEFVVELKKKREEIVEVLMWEIGKNRKDAEGEFDRTIDFIAQTIAVIRDETNHEFNSNWESIGSTRAFLRRTAIGILLCLGPFNYPLNETYATLIPALLMGNVVILKIPTVGGLAHLLTMEAFKVLPPGTINFISGSGRETMPVLMSSGSIDGLAFIGGSSAADKLIKEHPKPHRLKLFLQLEAKNMAIFMPDMFDPSNSRALETAIDEAVTGSLSFNGQRCTALKLIFVPKSHAAQFAQKMAEKVESLRIGLPWQTSDSAYSQITPLPNMKRVTYMKHLIADATAKGARILNENGGMIVGGKESTLLTPAVLYPVQSNMNIYHEEQFGPVVPIAEYDDISTVIQYGREGDYGQQCSIFTTEGGEGAASLVDKFSTVFGKINLNSQCGRSPDTLPFSGRRSSAMGIMSVADALREFSVPTVVSYKVKDDKADVIAAGIHDRSNFMSSL